MRNTPLVLAATVCISQLLNGVGVCQRPADDSPQSATVVAFTREVSEYSDAILEIARNNPPDKDIRVGNAKNQIAKRLTGSRLTILAIVDSLVTSDGKWQINLSRSELPIGDNQRKQVVSFVKKPPKALLNLKKGDVIEIVSVINKQTSKTIAFINFDLRLSSFIDTVPPRNVVRTLGDNDMRKETRMEINASVTGVNVITSPEESAKAVGLIQEIDRRRVEREKAR